MRVFFATAAYRGLWCPEFAQALAATVDLCKQEGHTATFHLTTGNCYIQLARNQVVKAFMGSGADVLFFLDDDVSWEPADALRLINMPDLVVGGAYPKKTEQADYPVVIKTTEEGYPLVRKDGAIEATGLPTGFLRVQRVVIEQLQALYPEQHYQEYENGQHTGENYDLFPQGVNNGRWVGEDFAFCRLCTDAGIPLWLVPDMTLTHHSAGRAYPGNYHNFLLAQPR